MIKDGSCVSNKRRIYTPPPSNLTPETQTTFDTASTLVSLDIRMTQARGRIPVRRPQRVVLSRLRSNTTA